MEELLPFIFFILWIVFGGIGSKKKREEAQRRAQAQREAAEAAKRARDEQRRAMRESREADGRSTFPEAQEPASSQGGTGTSLDMVPDELWAILTGGAPRPTGPSGPVEVPYDPEPASSGGWTTSPPWDEEDAVHSIEGVSTEAPENTVDYDDDADRIARARYENLKRSRYDDAASTDSIAVGQLETSDERHVDFHDRLRAGEIGAAAAAVRRPSLGARLGLRDRDDVRRAIVLSEILGPPKALR